MVGVKPAIAQLVEHLTVELAEIRWSLVRLRVAGFAWHHTWIKSWQMFCSVISTAYWAGALPTKLKEASAPACKHTHSGWRSFSGPSWAGTRAERLKLEVTVHIVRTQSLGNWVAGHAWGHTWIKSWQMFCSVISTSMSLLWDSSPRPPAYWAGCSSNYQLHLTFWGWVSVSFLMLPAARVRYSLAG